MCKGEFVGSDGASGGLISLWDDNFFMLEDKIMAQRYVLLVGVIKTLNFKCGFENVYAPNDDRERQIFWEDFDNVIKGIEIPWCLGGDFNVVRMTREKIGAVYNQAAMTDFSNFIEEVGLMDLPLSGGRFT